MKFYRLKNKQMPWGDYGEILFAGYNFQDKKSGNFYISRTAPFLPCVYRDPREAFLFITENLKTKLEQSSLKGLAFQQAIKDKIVSLAWETWNLSAPEPTIYPSGDMDAEEYIIRRKHNQQLAETMEDIWAVVLPIKGLATRNGELVLQSIGESDIFTVEINSGNILSQDIFVSEKAMLWFVEHSEDCLTFEPCITKMATDNEIDELRKSAAEKRTKQEMSDRMSDKDWQLWHRLINEAKRLIKEIDTAKQEKTKEKRKKKALENLLQAKGLYPLLDKESMMLETLLNDK